MRIPKTTIKHKMKYYSDAFQFKAGGRNTPYMQSSKEVRFYCRLDDPDPSANLWAQAKEHKQAHGYHTVMRVVSYQAHTYSTQP